MYKWQLSRRKKCLTQEELVKAYEGPDFDLADRYGEVSLARTHNHGGIRVLCPCLVQQAYGKMPALCILQTAKSCIVLRHCYTQLEPSSRA